MSFLPPANHPIWKTAQTFFSVVGIGILVWHLEHLGGHPGVDSDAVLGGAGTATGVKLIWQFLTN